VREAQAFDEKAAKSHIDQSKFRETQLGAKKMSEEKQDS
jgi:hypothetical protein